MSHVASNAKSRSLIAGVVSAAVFIWPAIGAESAVPNFSPDSRTGWIAGVPDGETPIGDLKVAVGPHEVIFRHPDLGEQRHAITVTAASPARLSVDLRKK